jgi:hypothetical protein
VVSFAGKAVLWVIGKNELKHGFAGSHKFRILCDGFHAFRNLCGAGAHCAVTGTHFNLGYAETAAACGFKVVIIAESGNIETCLFRSFQKGYSFFNLYFFAVNGYVDHGLSSYYGFEFALVEAETAFYALALVNSVFLAHSAADCFYRAVAGAKRAAFAGIGNFIPGQFGAFSGFAFFVVNMLFIFIAEIP